MCVAIHLYRKYRQQNKTVDNFYSKVRTNAVVVLIRCESQVEMILTGALLQLY